MVFDNRAVRSLSALHAPANYAMGFFDIFCLAVCFFDDAADDNASRLPPAFSIAFAAPSVARIPYNFKAFFRAPV